MDFLADPVLLARIQFALTAMYHFVFVPLSIGLGLIVAIFETKHYRSNKPEDAAASRFWIKVFTATFALGVATGHYDGIFVWNQLGRLCSLCR